MAVKMHHQRATNALSAFSLTSDGWEFTVLFQEDEIFGVPFAM